MSSTFEHLGISENSSMNIVGFLAKKFSKNKLLLSKDVANSNTAELEQLNVFIPEAVSLNSGITESVYSVGASESRDTSSNKESLITRVTFDNSLYPIDVNSPVAISNDLAKNLVENKPVISSSTDTDSYSLSMRSETSHLQPLASKNSSSIILVKKDVTHRNITESINIAIYQDYDSREDLNTSEDIAVIDANVKANETIQSNRDTNSLITLYADSMFSNDDEYFHDSLGEDELYASQTSSCPYKLSDTQYMEKSSNASMIAVLDFDLYGCNDLTDTTSQVAGSSKD